MSVFTSWVAARWIWPDKPVTAAAFDCSLTLGWRSPTQAEAYEYDFGDERFAGFAALNPLTTAWLSTNTIQRCFLTHSRICEQTTHIGRLLSFHLSLNKKLTIFHGRISEWGPIFKRNQLWSRNHICRHCALNDHMTVSKVISATIVSTSLP